MSNKPGSYLNNFNCSTVLLSPIYCSSQSLQLTSHNSLYDPFWSIFRRCQSTEASWSLTISPCLCPWFPSILISHAVLPHRLSSIGITSIPLDWFHSYLSGCTQFIQLSDPTLPRLLPVCPWALSRGPFGLSPIYSHFKNIFHNLTSTLIFILMMFISIHQMNLLALYKNGGNSECDVPHWKWFISGYDQMVSILFLLLFTNGCGARRHQ